MGEKYRPIVKKGTHLAQSKGDKGTYRGALLDDKTNKVVGQAEWELIEEEHSYNDYRDTSYLDEEQRERIEFYAELIADVVLQVGAAALPYVAKWWDEKGYPGVKRAWNGIITKDKKKTKKGNYNVTASTLDYLSKDIDDVLDYYSKNISSEEAQKHLINIVVLAMLLADEIRALSGVIIKDNDEISEHHLEWKTAFEKLTTQKVTDSINLILENNSSLLGDKKMGILSEILGDNLFEGGEFIPIKNEKMKEALLIEIR